MCRLCKLTKKIQGKHNEEEWTKTIKSKETTVKLKGTTYRFPDGTTEVIRYLDKDFLFINSLRDHADDVIICLPLKHMSNKEMIENGTLKKLYTKMLKFIQTQHNGNSRILQNIGPRFASIPEHAHLQITYNTKTDLYIPPMNKECYKETIKKKTRYEKNMKAVILAGGLGTRLRSKVNDKPKPMAEFKEKPLLAYLVEQLSKHFKEIILLIGYKADMIKQYFGNGSKWGIKITYSEEKEPLDTGGALKNAEQLIDEDFILINGDNYHELDYETLKKNFKKTNMNTMILTATRNPTQVAIIKTDENGLITGMKNRPQNPTTEDKLMNAGILLLKKDTIQLLPEGKSNLDKDLFPQLINNGLRSEEYKGYYIDIGTPENYEQFKKYCKNLIN